jgi:FMN phosphatase YigB (HAD superfamily)
MKYLTDKVAWDTIKVIGFDLDGTLYDEYAFVEQAYEQVTKAWGLMGHVQYNVLQRMLDRWLEKGSSYPHIFEETLAHLNINGEQKDRCIQLALSVFRRFEPKLQLSSKTKHILRVFKERFRLFLFTDGGVNLQTSKVLSLGLNEFFSEDAIFISGQYGSEYVKPKTNIVPELENVLQGVRSDRVLYIGDRVRDLKFAVNSGFEFCYISELFKTHG